MYPSTAFILTQQHEVKIIETVLDKIEAVEHYEYDIINFLAELPFLCKKSDII